MWAGNSDGHPMKNTSGLTGAAPIWHDFMEAVLAIRPCSPAWARRKAAAGWEFAPPADVERRNECPPGLACREGGEFFSKAWLAAAGEDGPLADSVALVPTAPVYVKRGDQGKWAAYCEVEPAAQRASSCGCRMASWGSRRIRLRMARLRQG